MTFSRILLSGTAALALLGTTACVTDPNTGEKKVSRTAIGGVGGAVLGGLLGSWTIVAASQDVWRRVRAKPSVASGLASVPRATWPRWPICPRPCWAWAICGTAVRRSPPWKV